VKLESKAVIHPSLIRRAKVLAPGILQGRRHVITCQESDHRGVSARKTSALTSLPHNTSTLDPSVAMGILDWFSSSSAPAAKGANEIPAPRSDSSVNAPSPEQHRRVIDFVRVSQLRRLNHQGGSDSWKMNGVEHC